MHKLTNKICVVTGAGRGIGRAIAALVPLVTADPTRDRDAARAAMLATYNPDHIESRILAARGAIGARDWKTARAALSAYAGTGASETPTQRICELMAEIEEGEFGDRGAARGWLARALHAPEDPQWTGRVRRASLVGFGERAAGQSCRRRGSVAGCRRRVRGA